MRRITYLPVCAALIAGGLHPLSAAEPAVEGFSAGANGWSGTSSLLTGAWQFTGGVAQISFAAIGIGFPDVATLSNTPSASSGSFTGDYAAAGIEAIGFSFYAANVLPASGAVELDWAGGTSSYRRAFAVAQTGVWYRFSASLREEDRDQWTVLTGSAENFGAARASVTRVALRVARTVTTAHDFRFDQIFIAGAPGGGAATAEAGTARLQWDGLLAGLEYEVQASTNLVAGSWTPAFWHLATGTVHTTVLTNQGPGHEAFRMQFR